MGTTAHIRICGPDDAVAHVYHRFDGDTLGSELAAHIDDLHDRLSTAHDTAAPFSVTAFATDWVARQNTQFAADLADLTERNTDAADMVSRFAAASIELVLDDSTAHIEWHEYQYEVVLGADRVVSLAEAGLNHEPRWKRTYPS